MSEQMVKRSVETEKFSVKKTVGYCSYKAAGIANSLFISYLSFYATDSLFLATVSIGMVLAFSRVFDGFTDIVAGFIIDKTDTKLGSARPWLLAGVAAYVMMIAMFSVPDLPDAGKLVWIFITYNLNSSIFGTIYNVCEAKLLKRITVKSQNRVRILTYTGIFMSILPMGISVALPILVASASGNPGQWSILAWGLGIGGIILTMIAFLCCKEYTKQELVEFGVLSEENEQKVKLKDMMVGIVKNKYFLMYLFVFFVNSFSMGISQACGIYYFSRNLGDMTLMSLTGLTGVVILPLMLVIPKLVQKIGGVNFVQCTLILGSVGCILRMLSGSNIVGLLISSVLANFILSGISFYGTELVIQCMEYGQLKNGVLIESVYNSALNFAMKIGMGISAAALGAVLGMFGYDGALAVQPDSALGAINFMYNIFPVICAVLMMIALYFCKVEEVNKKLREEQ